MPDRIPHVVTLVNIEDDARGETPFRSGITSEDYWLDPVVRAPPMPSTNLLIADDVSLGKIIEARLVMQELTLPHRARTMLIEARELPHRWRQWELIGAYAGGHSAIIGRDSLGVTEGLERDRLR